MLPLVQRELRVAARAASLYRNRLRFGILVVLAAGLLLLLASVHLRGPASAMFNLISFIALCFCLAEGLWRTADSISQEKRDGTLGFLFLTPLSGLDVVLGKFAAGLIRSLNGLLAFAPILAVTVLAGGTTLGDFWRVVLVLILALLLSLSLCLFLSVISRDQTMAAGALLLLSLCVLPILGSVLARRWWNAPQWDWVALASPFSLLMRASESRYSYQAAEFWAGAAGHFVFSLLLLLAASFILPRVWRDKAKRQKAAATQRGSRAEAGRRARQLDKNPILWAAFNARQARFFRVIFYGLALSFIIARFALSRYVDDVGLLFHGPALMVLTLVLYVYLASQASSNLVEARRGGALELLLSTPVKVADIIQGQILALREMFLMPALLLLGWYCYSFAIWIYASPPDLPPNMVLLSLITVVQYIFGILAIGGVGMWMGMTSKTPNRALFKTLLIGLLLPYLFCFPLLTFIIQLLLAAVAKDRVLTNFRRFVAEQYLQAPGFILAEPPAADPATPPVIR